MLHASGHMPELETSEMESLMREILEKKPENVNFNGLK